MGLNSVGYTYINIEDGWMASQRAANGSIQVDSTKFPEGIQSVINYVHSSGLKFGLYSDAGNFTCSMLPGSLGYEQIDA